MTSLTDVYTRLANPNIQRHFTAKLPAMNQAWDNPGTVAMMANQINGFIRVDNTLYEVEYKGKSYNFYTVEEFMNDENDSQRFATIAEIEAWAQPTATTNVEISDSEYNDAVNEFTHIATNAGGMHSTSYQTSTDYEFVCWFEDEFDIPFDFSSELIQHTVTFDESMNAYKFNMTLAYQVNNA